MTIQLAQIRREYKPITDTPTLQLHIVDDVEPCKFCGKPRDGYVPIPNTRRPEPEPKQPVVIDGEVLKPAAPKRKALPAPAAPAEKPHPPGIHEQNGARMQVLDYSAKAVT